MQPAFTQKHHKDRKSFIIYSLHHNFYNSTKHRNESQSGAKRPAVNGFCQYLTLLVSFFHFGQYTEKNMLLTSKQSKQQKPTEKTQKMEDDGACSHSRAKTERVKMFFFSQNAVLNKKCRNK